MIKRLLIANRGEIAVRIIAACRELGIETVAIYSDADAHARHVAAADRSFRIGAAAARESYLAIPKVIEAARATGADAVHPGYGFLSENAAFATACAEAGLIFVGPPAGVIARMGSKVAARQLMASAGVPVVPGETPDDQSDEGLLRAIDCVGLPALLKASSGGGGKGMRRIEDFSRAAEAIRAARRESASAFGDGTLYVERFLERPRHVEVQIFADNNGHVVHLFERDCSVQRRYQKVIEESPSPGLSAATREQMAHTAIAAAQAAEYRNAGTVEFVVEGRSFYFLEMNTRLQVEHPVTEQSTGVDLVRAQLLVASGEPLPWPQDAIAQRGHSIEARVYAEDPAHDFLPQAGRLSAYREPRRPGIRVDSGVREGDEIPVHYDPMIAKVIATAENRDLAINRLRAALQEFLIDGIVTNIGFLLRILELDEFRAGKFDTTLLDRNPLLPISERRPSIGDHPIADRRFFDPWEGLRAAAPAKPRPRTRRRPGPAHATRQELSAPMPATVIEVLVTAGATVSKGDVVVLLEAMKMEHPIRAPADAVVVAVHCRPGELVQADQPLVEIE